ncbi:MAG: calcium/sodium antiporter [Rhodospirillaceae bacterium]|nr:calcium/sodium antiporter [Rhodospirillaceae bacterium]MBT5565640.1 calcium/sodium antiporter [Rhodospirillaceae bacterium]MBT6090846.1 calcium/sodium antiporter [Rhodospirillaceae bacterium]MBT6962031.1 calcium/sodium antiporter [Rhodospirillaceae bacterium]
MSDLIPYAYLIIGLILLSGGADYLIRGAVAVATRMNISPLVVGLTIVALGTSLPELIVCVRAAMAGASGIAVGNIVGSNIANILLIIGAGALMCPISANRNHFLRDSLLMLGATGLFIAIALTGSFAATSGAIMIALLFVFLIFSYVQGRKHGTDDLSMIDMDEIAAGDAVTPLRATLWIVGGLIGVAVGAELLVGGATTIARGLGVSEEVIGLTMVAIGTSLPELATVIAAAAKRQTDLIVGNVMGSNIFNILGVMGVTATVADVPVGGQILTFDIWVMAAAALILVPLMLSGSILNRKEGTACLALYAAYIAVQYIGVERVFS